MDITPCVADISGIRSVGRDRKGNKKCSPNLPGFMAKESALTKKKENISNVNTTDKKYIERVHCSVLNTLGRSVKKAINSLNVKLVITTSGSPTPPPDRAYRHP
jgi:hypothetical protein